MKKSTEAFLNATLFVFVAAFVGLVLVLMVQDIGWWGSLGIIGGFASCPVVGWLLARFTPWFGRSR